MSNSGQFDEHIKNQLLEYSPPVPRGIWDSIEAERKKRRPVGFWFSFFNRKNMLLLAGLLIAAAGGSYILLHHPANTSIADTPAATTHSVPATTASEGSIAANSKGEMVTATVTMKDKEAPLPVATNNNNNDADGNTGTGKPRFAAAASKINIRAGVAGEIIAASNSTNNKQQQSAALILPGNGHAITNAAITAGDITAQEFLLAKMQYVAVTSNSQKQLPALQKNIAPHVFLPGCPAIEKDAAGNKAYIEIYGGPDIAFRNLSDTGNSTYLQKRKESTSFTSAYSAGLRYTRVFSNGMSIRTGINFSQINEKFTYVKGNLVQITYIIDANGDTTGSYITTGTRYKTTHNKFRTIDIPLVMGYELGNGKIHANINAGVIVNVYSWQKGEVLDNTLQPVSINTGKSSSPYQFKTNIGLGFLAGVSVYYKLNDKAHLLAEPYFRYSLAPMSKENLTFKQKYNTAGLRLGLRVDLQ